MRPLEIGLIGAGKHGSRYAKHIVEDVGEATLAAICRRDRIEGKRLADRYHCLYYADYRQLLADTKIDAIAVVVPPSLHEEIVFAACSAGKHILIEKPFAVNLAEARRMRARIEASPGRCMVAHTLRFSSVVRALKAHIPEIAPLHSVYLSQGFEPSPLAWLDCKAQSGGGIILHTGVHSFDLLRFLSGTEVERVWCQTSTVATRETEDNFLMMCRTSEPLLTAQVAGSRSTNSRTGLIVVTGEQGQLVGDHVHNFAYLTKGLDRTALAIESLVPTVRETVRAFAQAILEETPFPITVGDGICAVAIADACYRSAETNAPAVVQA